MNSTEAKKKLWEIGTNLDDKEANKAVRFAIIAIDTCERAGFEVSPIP